MYDEAEASTSEPSQLSSLSVSSPGRDHQILVNSFSSLVGGDSRCEVGKRKQGLIASLRSLKQGITVLHFPTHPILGAVQSETRFSGEMSCSTSL